MMLKQKYYLIFLTMAVLGVIFISGCVQKQPSKDTGEMRITPEPLIIYQDYIETIGEGFRSTPPVYDSGMIEATVISITKSEVCPYQEENCSIESYPNDWGVVRIDKIIDYTPYSEQTIGQPVEQPSGTEPSGEEKTTPGYKGQDLPKPKLLEYESLQEGQEVSTHFILTTRPAKVRYITVYVPSGGPEAVQTPLEIGSEQAVVHKVEPGKKVFKPIPKEPVNTDLPRIDDYYYVFTTKVSFTTKVPYSEAKEEPVTEFKITEKVLPSLEVGDKFIAEIRHDGTLHVEEYNIAGLKQITTNESQQVSPAIYGNKIVWADTRNGNWDIYTYDLKTKQEKQITTDLSAQVDPDIYENKIVYADNRSGNVEIYLYDLETGMEKRITNSEAQQASPKIFKNIIMWMDNRQDIYIYNLETGEEKQLTSNVYIWAGPFEIYGNKIVWEDMRTGGDIDVSVYNLETGNKTRIELPDAQVSPDIYDNKIVWLDYNPPHINGDVFLYNINTGEQTQITFDNFIQQYNPKIYGNKIVWMDQKINGVEDIWLYDLETGQEKRITKDPSSQQAPEIFENNIVWADNRNGNWDIYMYEIIE